MMNKLRFALVEFLWKFKPIWRNYCWAAAVMWSLGDSDVLFKETNHDCHYCGSCNTPEERAKYQEEHSA